MDLFICSLGEPTALLTLGILVLTVVLAVVSARAEGRGRVVFRLCCALPVVGCLIHAAFLAPLGHTGMLTAIGIGAEVYKVYVPRAILLFEGLYLGALLVLLMMLTAGRGWWRRVLAVGVCLGVAACGTKQVLEDINCYDRHNMTHLGWTDAFAATVETMREGYILREWKETDFDALLAEHLPAVEAAEAAGDEAAYGAALLAYAYDFYDGHVSLIVPHGKSGPIRERLAGNDYGLSLFTLDDGQTIAVCVEEDTPAYRAGLRNGTVIETWDGIPVAEAAAAVSCVYPGYGMYFPVKENEARYQAIFLAGKGGGTVTVGYLDEDGAAQTAVLEAAGSYRMRLGGALSCFAHDWIEDDNFSTRMLSDTCGYLRLEAEDDGTITQYLAYLHDGMYPQLTDRVSDQLTDLAAQGMRSLVIDLRGNEGGLNAIGAAVSALFSDEARFQFAEGERVDGGYEITHTYHIAADGRWKDLPVAVLVDQGCCSAGDGAALFLSQCENVTLMGLTPSNGVNQNNGGECYLPCGYRIVYPVRLSLGEDAKPLIDTDASRETRLPLDVQIPVDKAAALRIFGEDETDDYALAYAVQYLMDKEG